MCWQWWWFQVTFLKLISYQQICYCCCCCWYGRQCCGYDWRQNGATMVNQRFRGWRRQVSLKKRLGLKNWTIMKSRLVVKSCWVVKHWLMAKILLIVQNLLIVNSLLIVKNWLIGNCFVNGEWRRVMWLNSFGAKKCRRRCWRKSWWRRRRCETFLMVNVMRTTRQRTNWFNNK